MNPTSGIVRNDRVKATLQRGESLNIQVRVYGNPAGDCGAVVVGDPESLVGYALTAFGEVEGDALELPIVNVKVEPITLGTATVPAELSISAEPDMVARVFQPGALQSFTFQVLGKKPGGESRSLVSGRVIVKDSASGVGA